MPHFEIGSSNTLYYEHSTPTRPGAMTFVFVNALTGTTAAWEDVTAPILRDQGHGTLSYNFRGQTGSAFDPEIALTPELIVDDLCRLVDALRPINPVFVGLSIGGLFAAQAVLRGVAAKGLVLLNTLREIGPRIAWVNDAMPTVVGAGGIALFLDCLFPLLVNEEFAERARPNFLKGSYQALDPAHGHMNLMRHAGSANWDLAYEALDLPVLLVTGLQDRVFLDLDVVARLKARIGDVRAEEWADAGHLIPQERPEKLAESLLRFAGELEG